VSCYLIGMEKLIAATGALVEMLAEPHRLHYFRADYVLDMIQRDR
jgi:hypothetical protein